MERWKSADKGQLGFPIITFTDFYILTAERRKEAMATAGNIIILGKEGLEETFVVMTVEEYAKVKINENFKPRVFQRIKGELWGKL